MSETPAVPRVQEQTCMANGPIPNASKVPFHADERDRDCAGARGAMLSVGVETPAMALPARENGPASHVRLERRGVDVGDHHHFVTPLRPGRVVPGSFPSAFPAAPKLRGSPRSSAHRPARGCSPVQSAQGAEGNTWGLNERPSARKQSELQPTAPSTVVTEPMIWRQLEVLTSPQIKPQQRKPVPPPREDAAVRFIVQQDLRDDDGTRGANESIATIVSINSGSVDEDAVWGHAASKQVVASNMNRIGHGPGDSSAHTARPIARVEEIHALCLREQAAVAKLQDSRWAAPSRPLSHHAQRRPRPMSPRDSPVAADQMPSPASPYNIEQYFRTMWDTDRAAALAGAGAYRVAVATTAPTAASGDAPLETAAPQSRDAGMAIEGVTTPVRSPTETGPSTGERTEVYRLGQTMSPGQAVSTRATATRRSHSSPSSKQQQQQQQQQVSGVNLRQLADGNVDAAVLHVSSASINGPASEPSTDGPSGFGPITWREVSQPLVRVSDGEAIVSPGRQGNMKVRGGAFGKFEIHKAAQTAAARRGQGNPSYTRHSVPGEVSVGQLTPRAGLTPATTAAVDPQRSIVPSTVKLLGDLRTQLSLGKGTGSPQRTAESVAADYCWRPTENLKWIPGLVPARGPVLSPCPQSDVPSPQATTRPLRAGSAHTCRVYGSRPATAESMEWTRKGVEMNLAGPLIRVSSYPMEAHSLADSTNAASDAHASSARDGVGSTGNTEKQDSKQRSNETLDIPGEAKPAAEVQESVTKTPSATREAKLIVEGEELDGWG